MSLRAVDPDVRFLPAFVLLAATTFGVTLPPAPGFLGTAQATNGTDGLGGHAEDASP